MALPPSSLVGAQAAVEAEVELLRARSQAELTASEAAAATAAAEKRAAEAAKRRPPPPPPPAPPPAAAGSEDARRVKIFMAVAARSLGAELTELEASARAAETGREAARRDEQRGRAELASLQVAGGPCP